MLTHIDENGRARMVEVGDKKETKRIAIASGRVLMKAQTLKRIQEGGIQKGDVLAVAQVAGIMAAKRTFEMIPMCHPLLLTGVRIDFSVDEGNNAVEIKAEVSTTGKTGVEMEALHAVTASALTIYDMCKAMDKSMIIDGVQLEYKAGGKSGEYRKEDKPCE